MTLTAQTTSIENLSFPGFLSVGTFGAKGDGATDDRVAIQAAITAAAALGGCTIYFPPGIYQVSRAPGGGVFWCLTIPNTAKGITFEGVRDLSWLQMQTGLPNVSISLLQIDRSTDITFRSMGFDGNWGNAVTTIAQASTGLTLPQATISVDSTAPQSGAFPASGSFSVVTATGTQVVNYTGVTATTFTGCTGGTGIIMRGNKVVSVNAHTGINQANQSDPSNFLIFNRGGENILIEDCKFKQAYGDFVWNGTSNIDHTKWARNVRIVNCDGDISARNAVTLGSAVIGLVVDRCRFTNIFAQAIDGEPQSYPVRDVTVQNCYLDGWADPSLGFGSAPVSVVGADLNGYALPASAAQNWRVINNRIIGSCFVQYAQDVIIAGNHFVSDWTGNTKSSIQIDLGSGDVTIENNYFYSRTGISGIDDAGNAVINVYDYTTAPDGQFNPPNVKIRGNRIHVRNGRYGISVVAGGAEVQTASGVATSVTGTTVVLTGAGWTTDEWTGAIVRIGTAEMAISTNTTDTLTGQLVDNSVTTGWQLDSGAYAPTPAAGAFEIFRLAGVIDVESNDIDGRDDGNGGSSYGIRITNVNSSSLIGQRTRVRNNTIKDCGTSGIHVDWTVGANPMRLVDISGNHGLDDQPTPTMTNLIEYNGTPDVTRWVMANNTIGDGVTNIVTGLTAGQWLVSDGNVQFWAGFGSPAGVVAAPVGSLYQRVDGGAGTTLYVKETGAATSAGWVAK